MRSIGKRAGLSKHQVVEEAGADACPAVCGCQGNVDDQDAGRRPLDPQPAHRLATGTDENVVRFREPCPVGGELRLELAFEERLPLGVRPTEHGRDIRPRRHIEGAQKRLVGRLDRAQGELLPRAPAQFLEGKIPSSAMIHCRTR